MGGALLTSGDPLRLNTQDQRGYVAEDAASLGTHLSVLILGEERAATVLDGPVFDPENEQLLG